MKHGIGLAMAAALSAGAASAAAVPQPVADYAQGLRERCLRLGGQPNIAAPQQVELTGDRLADWLVVEGMGDCPGAPGARDGGQVTVYVGQADGSVTPVFQQGIFGLRIEKQKGRPVLFLATRGPQCGEAGKVDPALVCDRPLIWKPEQKVLDYGPASSIRVPSRIAP